MQASPVVPVPAKGSNTLPSLGVTNRTRYFIRSNGFTVGWSEPFFSFLLAFTTGQPFGGISLTDPAFAQLQDYLIYFIENNNWTVSESFLGNLFLLLTTFSGSFLAINAQTIPVKYGPDVSLTSRLYYSNPTALNFSSERTSYYQITDNLIKVIDPSGNFYHVDSRGMRHGEFELTQSIDRMTNITVKGQMNNGNYIGKVFHLVNGQLALIRVYDQNGNLTKTTRIHDMNAISRSIAQK